MAIAFDASASIAYGAGLSWTHTCGPGATCLFVYIRDDGAALTGITYNGVALVLLTSVTLSGGSKYYLYYQVTPAIGAYSVAVSGSATIAGASVSYAGTGSIIPDAQATASGTGLSSISVNVTTVAPNTWAVLCVSDRSGVSPTVCNFSGTRVSPGGGASMTVFDTNGLLPTPTTYTGATTVSGTAGAIIASFADPTGTSALTVTINGTDRTRLVSRYETTIDQTGDGTPDHATVMVRGFTPTVGMEVKILQGGSLVLFDGVITALELVQRRNGTRKRYRCTCADWTFLFDRRLVLQTWKATAANTIVAALVTNFTTGFTTTNVQSALAAVDFSCFLEAPSQALKRLADQIGAVFKVRYDKDIHFRTSSNLPNPSTLDTTNRSYFGLAYHRHYDQIRNRIYVRGVGSTLAANVPIGSIYAPVNDTFAFASAGSKASAASQILSYTSKVLGLAITVPGVTWGSITNIADGGAGSLTVGVTYMAALTFVTLAGETTLSNASVASGATDATHRAIRWAWTVAAPSSAIGMNIYISKDAGVTWKMGGATSPVLSSFQTLVTISAEFTAPPSINTAGNEVATASTTTSNTAVGATVIAVAATEVFAASGGIVTYSVNGILYSATYTGRSVTGGAGNLTGVPATGSGAVLVNIPNGASLQNVPGILGIPASSTGSVTAQLKVGEAINIFAQRDDATSQTAIAAAEGGDGIHEFFVNDASLDTVTECNQVGDAELSLGKNIQEDADFISEDVLCVPAASAVLNVAGLSATIPIAHVSIRWTANRKNPQRTVTCTSQYKTLSQYLGDLQHRPQALL